MNGRAWFAIGISLDIVLLAIGTYMAISAADIAIRTQGDTGPTAIAILFGALPLLCFAAPVAAWRARRRKRLQAQIIALFAAPWVYALFLVVFLFNS